MAVAGEAIAGEAENLIWTSVVREEAVKLLPVRLSDGVGSMSVKPAAVGRHLAG